MTRQRIQTSDAPEAIGPYSQGIRAGGWVFTAGQLGGDPETGDLPEGIEAQTRQALENVRAILREAGLDWEHVVKTSVFLSDLGDFQAFNAVYAGIVREPFPARSTVEVAALPKGALIEIDAVARGSRG